MGGAIKKHKPAHPDKLSGLVVLCPSRDLTKEQLHEVEMQNDQIEVSNIELKAGERLVISTNEWRGRKFVDVRIWFQSEERLSEVEWKPTKKGFRVSKEHFQELTDEIIRAAEIIADCE